MTKLFSSLFALLVASATTLATAQAPAQPAPAAGSGPAIETKVAMCIGCHGIPGYQSSFPEVHRVPMISGQSAKYLAAALTAYRSGERKHPSMRGLAAGLSDQDITRISAWYEAHGKGRATPPEQPRQPTAQTAALLQKGGCVACHGANFNKPIDPTYPKIAGQHKDYLFVALKAYKADGSVVGRSNGVMSGVVKQFSNAELKAMANYIGSLDGELIVQPQSHFR
jgi:cytochrome c553